MANFISRIKLSAIAKISFVAIIALLSALLVTSCAGSEYNSSLKTPVLKKPDIIQNGVLKVGINFGNPPLAGDSSKASGIDVDVASAIAEELGLEAEFIDVGNNGDTALSSKKVDIVMGLSKATNYENMWKSDVYLQTACAIFAKNSNEKIPTKEGNDNISSQMGSSSALAAQAQFNVANVKFENNVSNCFEKLNNGEVKYVAADAVVGTYFSKVNDVSASIIALLTKPSGYCIGVSKENSNLSENIKNALETISKGGVTSVIEKKWLGKSLGLDGVTLTPEASNQADAGELGAGVYAQTGPNPENKNPNLH